MIHEEQLSRIFSSVGRWYGYSRVEAGYAEIAPTELRVCGNVSCTPRVEISSELMDAPEDVLRGIAKGVFGSVGDCTVRFPSEVDDYFRAIATGA